MKRRSDLLIAVSFAALMTVALTLPAEPATEPAFVPIDGPRAAALLAAARERIEPPAVAEPTVEFLAQRED